MSTFSVLYFLEMDIFNFFSFEKNLSDLFPFHPKAIMPDKERVIITANARIPTFPAGASVSYNHPAQ